MQRSVLRFLATMIMSIGMASSYGLAPGGTQTFSRRHALDRLVGFGSISLVGLVAPSVLAAENTDENAETTEQKKARELKEKIAASKKNFRKADNYAKERFTTVDYSCVADTGSPCKEPKSVFPSDGKIENL
jgi:mannitol-specific phosphotransferase system IIBC component